MTLKKLRIFVEFIRTVNYLAIPALGKIGGLQVIGRFLTDPIFLKYLEEATLTTKQERFIQLLNEMRPSIERAMVKASLEAYGEEQMKNQEILKLEVRYTDMALACWVLYVFRFCLSE